MNIGMAGMGKLGLPVALAIESQGHQVTGFDVRPEPYTYRHDREIPYEEEGAQELLDHTRILMTKSLGILVARSDIIFVPVQTPHEPQYEGVTRLPEDRADFNYNYLTDAVGLLSQSAGTLGVKSTVAVISTCLPGTYEREIKPLTENLNYVYTPQFIAMGSVIEDYLHPEFNLVGVEDEETADQLEEFYSTINDAPVLRTDITTAEGIKVAYNTWITAKTVIANAWGEVAHRTGMDFDALHRSWELSDKRLLSSKYMDSGMSDGGGCHPRDNIALSWLAREVGVSHNIWDDLMKAREDFEQWHADLIIEQSQEHDLPAVILGRSFKPETNIETGSPSVLLANLVDERMSVTHVEDLDDPQPAVYFLGTKHDRYKDLQLPKGSVVIDPFRFREEQEGVTLIPLGGRIK